MKRLIVDLDDTLTVAERGVAYQDVQPRDEVVKRLREYHDQGFTIVIHTSRNMQTFRGDVGLINVNTLPVILDWLERHDIPHDEVVVGKPWCGTAGFYVDDRAVRPSEFVALSYPQVCELLGIPQPTEG